VAESLRNHEARIPVAGLVVSYFAATLSFHLADSVTGVGLLRLIAGYLFVSILAGWVVRDSLQRGRRHPYDFDSFVAILWVVVIPLYLWKTRRWRGALIFLLGIVAALLIEFAALFIIPSTWEQSP